ncbi:MAG: class I SAM-dependent methyltransferase [Cyanothece sp. SIO2G6]|nr:class I SAM-dependent methyltransferase [Cyanothece sp. SIO2G6]
MLTQAIPNASNSQRKQFPTQAIPKEVIMEATAQTYWLNNLQVASNYNNWIFSQFQPWLGDRTLEVGCGTGNFSELLAQHSQHLTALDLEADYVQYTKQRLQHCPNVEVLQADATQLAEQQAFDSIVMLDVLEHIEDDITTLMQLKQSLSADGFLIIKVPALQSLYGAMDEVIGHHRRYSQQTLNAALTQAGFGPSRLWYFNIAGIPGWWLNGSLLKRTTPPSSQVGLFDQVVPVLRAIESAVKPPVGLSLFAIARKH